MEYSRLGWPRLGGIKLVSADLVLLLDAATSLQLSGSGVEASVGLGISV